MSKVWPIGAALLLAVGFARAQVQPEPSSEALGSAPGLPVPSDQTRALVDSAKARAAQTPQDVRDLASKMQKQIDQQMLGSPDAQGAPHSSERVQALAQLGIPQEGTGLITILVSNSMPEPMLRSYAESAVWVGGTLTFRGVTPGETITSFIRDTLGKLSKPNASPDITLDPRPFSAYGVESVPAIVYTLTPPEQLCPEQVLKPVPRKGKAPLPVRECAPAKPDTYWKMTGAVSLRYALEEFVHAGAPGADRLLRAIESDPLHGTDRNVAALDADQYKKASGPGSVKALLDLMHAPVPAAVVNQSDSKTGRP